MKTEWDYTNLAEAYLKRPDYAYKAIDRILEISNVKSNDCVCDVGAGVAHLTLMLAKRGLKVVAVEPNDKMRENGIKRTKDYANVVWEEGVGEATGQNPDSFSLVTFGSSFNVTDRQLALNETHRILKKDGWFTCLWNHRDLNDPIQKEIEKIIIQDVPSYSYGTRREDQTDIINENGKFGEVISFSEKIVHSVEINDVIEAWRSHGTLERQAGGKFNDIVNKIEEYLLGLSASKINVPYITVVWMAQVIK